MSKYRLNFGRQSEDEAAFYLRKNGYKILEVNYRTRLGEIDIIARDKATICFVEVKSRSSLERGYPKEAIGSRKQARISRGALVYLKENNLFDNSCRFDVLSIIRDEEGVRSFELIKDAFCLDERYSY